MSDLHVGDVARCVERRGGERRVGEQLVIGGHAGEPYAEPVGAGAGAGVSEDRGRSGGREAELFGATGECARLGCGGVGNGGWLYIGGSLSKDGWCGRSVELTHGDRL